ncbi:MAG: hypothetical protein O7E52_06645, partial [Candidatus Poribacteria bacterium]|nr:hypothetical protein [Candidatus Poribacteria bacterium]
WIEIHRGSSLMKRRPLKWSVSSDFAIFALNLMRMGEHKASPLRDNRGVFDISGRRIDERNNL